jgi:hypothetical protein
VEASSDALLLRSAAMHALPRLSEALKADVHVTLCMYDVMRLVKDLRLWVSRYRNQAEKGRSFGTRWAAAAELLGSVGWGCERF